jgi:hypothetical protein
LCFDFHNEISLSSNMGCYIVLYNWQQKRELSKRL